MAKPTLEQFGVGVRALRVRRGLTQDELAARCGLHRTYVGGIERGERNISFKTLLRLADALDVSASELVGFAYGDAP